MPDMKHNELEAAQRFVEGLLRQSTADEGDPALTARLIRMEALLRRAYAAFVELRAQQEAGAEELARLRDRLRVVEALVAARPARPPGRKLRERWAMRWRAFTTPWREFMLHK